MLEPDGVIALVNQVASESHKNVIKTWQREKVSVFIQTNSVLWTWQQWWNNMMIEICHIFNWSFRPLEMHQFNVLFLNNAFGCLMIVICFNLSKQCLLSLLLVYIYSVNLLHQSTSYYYLHFYLFSDLTAAHTGDKNMVMSILFCCLGMY